MMPRRDKACLVSTGTFSYIRKSKSVPLAKHIIISVTNDLSMDQRIHRIASTLSESGFKVTVVGRMMPHSKELSPRPYQTKRFSMLFKKGFLFYAAYNFRLFWYLIFHRADFLNANDLDTLLANFLASKFKKAKLVYDTHEFFTELPELINRPKVRNFWLKIERWIFPKLNKIYTVNRSIADKYEERYYIPVHVIRNLPLKRKEILSSERKKILIYQGALNEGRGLELMISAMKFLPGYLLQIYGGGTIESELRKLVIDQQLQECVYISGWLRFEELLEKTAEGILGLSLEEDKGENYRLALPNKLFDYIQAWVPVLVSDLPEMKSVVGTWKVGECLAVEDRTPEGLSKKIRTMVEDSKTWNGYFQACMKASNELCWEKEKSKLLEIYGS